VIVLSHRGYWKDAAERNQVIAFERSFSLGFGTETDIRDYNGNLVISHDIADENCISVDVFFDMYNSFDNTLPLALNIKSDGLQIKLKELIGQYKIENYFVFDMSVPDGIQYLNNNIKSFTRQSEFETDPSFYGASQGVWLDEFNGHWVNRSVIKGHIKNNKRICIVSPELHKRNYQYEWKSYKEIEQLIGVNSIMICTDYPEEARRYFYG
jgi:hypothetical protein